MAPAKVRADALQGACLHAADCVKADQQRSEGENRQSDEQVSSSQQVATTRAQQQQPAEVSVGVLPRRADFRKAECPGFSATP